MDLLERFYDSIRREMAVRLATAADGRVSMRCVSPVYCEGDILIFTAPDSLKYRQLRQNPRCCVSVGDFYAEAEAAFMGETMADANAALRALYCGKFPGAFDEGLAFGGRAAEFIRLKPLKLTGWRFENDVPGADGVPTIPFEIDLT